MLSMNMSSFSLFVSLFRELSRFINVSKNIILGKINMEILDILKYCKKLLKIFLDNTRVQQVKMNI